MAPNFLSKFVRAATPTTNTRERVSSDSPASPQGSDISARHRSLSASINSGSTSPTSNPVSPTTPTQANSSRRSTNSTGTSNSAENRIPSIITTISNGTKGLGRRKSKGKDRSSSPSREGDRKSVASFATFETQPNVTIVPPSPLVHNAEFTDSENEDEDEYSNTNPTKTTEEDVVTPTPTPTLPQQTFNQGQAQRSTALRSDTSATIKPANPASSTTTTTDNMPSTLAPGPFQIRKQSSNKSLGSKKGTLSDIKTSPDANHSRAATAPAEAHTTATTDNGTVTAKPIVDSPTEVKFPNSSSTSSTNTSTNGGPPGIPPVPPLPNGISSSSSSNVSAVQRENTLTVADAKGKRPWRRSTTRKPTGLSALAASGLAMANPSMSAAHHAQISPPPILTAASSKSSSGDGKSAQQPYMSRSPAASSVSQRSNGNGHNKTRSNDISPRSTKSRKSSMGSAGSRAQRSRRSSNAAQHEGEHVNGGGTLMNGDDNSVRPDYYSGLELGSSDEDDDDSGSDSLELGEDDIPVTGFAVASNKRNADFHELFPTVPEGDYLIEDYGCALQREILIQGRIYISENHICFHANIFGWITDLSIPIYEITSLEKKMTAFVIPNAIQITTRQAKYTFASFLSRDTTFDVIYNIWRLARPEDNVSSGRGSMEGPVAGGGQSGAGGAGAVVPGHIAITGGGGQVAVAAGTPARKATQCTCGKEGKHYTETAMDVVIPGTPEKIHNLIFASGFIKDFMTTNQRLLDIQISDWAPVSPGSRLLTRNMSYIKPLNGSLGPKQTKCELRDEMVNIDFEHYISTVTTTRTPDVPSGGVFSVKTRTCIMWAGPISSKVLVTTQVEWTGRSFIKGIIERSAIDGQKVYHKELETAMRTYIQEHKSEFLPEGVDAAVIEVVADVPLLDGAPHLEIASAMDAPQPSEEERKKRERDRNARGLQWAWDTFDGALQVAIRSTKGALELISDAFDQSSTTTILWFVIAILVISNLWTLMRVNSARRKLDRRYPIRQVEDQEKWVQSIVTALWEELEASKREAAMLAESVLHPVTHAPHTPHTVVDPPPLTSQEVVGATSANMTTADDAEPKSWAEEVQHLQDTLDAVERRVNVIRESLSKFDQLDALD